MPVPICKCVRACACASVSLSLSLSLSLCVCVCVWVGGWVEMGSATAWAEGKEEKIPETKLKTLQALIESAANVKQAVGLSRDAIFDTGRADISSGRVARAWGILKKMSSAPASQARGGAPPLECGVEEGERGEDDDGGSAALLS